MMFLHPIRTAVLTVTFRRASRVDIKKLEKQEAKLRAKIDKRAKRDLYEGSKLLDQARKQVISYPDSRGLFLDETTVAIIRGDVYEGECTTIRFTTSVDDPQINPLEAAAASKNKSKDVHLTNLEVNFASNRIL